MQQEASGADAKFTSHVGNGQSQSEGAKVKLSSLAYRVQVSCHQSSSMELQ